MEGGVKGPNDHRIDALSICAKELEELIHYRVCLQRAQIRCQC